MTWLFALWGKTKIWAGIALAVLVAIGVAFLRGRAAGIQHMEAEQARRRIEAIKERQEVDDEVDQMGSTDLDSNYSKWLRDDDR